VRPLKIGRRQTRGFVLIDPPAYRTETALAKWVEQGLATAKAKRSAAKVSDRRNNP
jgi:hypothetical protein